MAEDYSWLPDYLIATGMPNVNEILPNAVSITTSSGLVTVVIGPCPGDGGGGGGGGGDDGTNPPQEPNPKPTVKLPNEGYYSRNWLPRRGDLQKDYFNPVQRTAFKERETEQFGIGDEDKEWNQLTLQINEGGIYGRYGYLIGRAFEDQPPATAPFLMSEKIITDLKQFLDDNWGEFEWTNNPAKLNYSKDIEEIRYRITCMPEKGGIHFDYQGTDITPYLTSHSEVYNLTEAAKTFEIDPMLAFLNAAIADFPEEANRFWYLLPKTYKDAELLSDITWLDVRTTWDYWGPIDLKNKCQKVTQAPDFIEFPSISDEDPCGSSEPPAQVEVISCQDGNQIFSTEANTAAYNSCRAAHPLRSWQGELVVVVQNGKDPEKVHGCRLVIRENGTIQTGSLDIPETIRMVGAKPWREYFNES